MLEVRQLSAAYGQHPALQDVSLKVNTSEIVVILGANGAGKSTLLRAIAGVCEGKVQGEITLAGKSLLGLSPDRIVEGGLALVPEGRGIFGELSVKENLLLGAYSPRARATETENLKRVLELFPKLGERKNQIARTMSGGEQQMVAIGRAMMSAPDILMLDEPSLGLSPLLCKELFESLSRVKELGIGILLVEQNAKQSLAIADRGCLLENTRITHEDTAANLATDPAVQKAYLGVSASVKASTPLNSSSETIEPPSTDTLASDALSTVAFTASVGEIRRNADMQIGGSIEDIVAKASEASANNSNNSRSTYTAGGVSAMPAVSSSEVKQVTLDIEKAAQAARSRAGSRLSSRRQATQPVRRSATSRVELQNSDSQSHNKQQIEEKQEPVVIEVYKRPRVEVYRRRPSGEFERD